MGIEVVFRRWRSALAFVVIVIGLGVVSLAVWSIVMVSCPSVVAHFSHSSEFKRYYGKCMEVRKGQTMQEVRAIMGEFQIASQSRNAVVFNTPKFSADWCIVRFTDEAVPRVTSIDFDLD